MGEVYKIWGKSVFFLSGPLEGDLQIQPDIAGLR
jgi:hypothetical protein